MAIAEKGVDHVHIQTRDSGVVDVWRVNEAGVTIGHDVFEDSESGEAILQDRESAAHKKLSVSEVNLGLNIAVSAVIFLEALRRRSRVLALVGLAAGVVAINANDTRRERVQELSWLGKEAIELENLNEKNSTPVPQE
jgi:hypothetical protein